MRFREHCSNVIRHGAICPLCYTILLWSIACCVPSVNATFTSEFQKYVGHILFTLVILQSTNLLFEMVFCPCFVLPKCIKCLTLPFQQNGTFVTGAVINKCNPISVAMIGLFWKRTMQVTVDKLQRAFGTYRSGREWVGVHLTSKTRFAYRIWLF